MINSYPHHRFYQTAFALFMALALLPGSEADAHKDDYLDETFVYETVSAGTFLPEFRIKYSGPSRDSTQPGFRTYAPFIEYGITDYTMIEGRLAWGTPAGEGEFAGGFLQLRHRFGQEGVYIVDPAVVIEYDSERDAGRLGHFFTPILILSKDIGELNVTANLIFRQQFTPESDFEFQSAMGLRYPRHGVRLSLEWKNLDARQRYVLSGVQFPVADLSIKAGAGTGVNPESPRFLAIILLEVEFDKDGKE